MTFGERLKRIRNGKGMTQLALSLRSGIAATVISNFECSEREPSLKNLIRLRDALECRWNELLGK